MYIRLFNCSVDMFSANWWMILHLTECNVNPYLTNPHFTKRYVYSFSTKALIFVIKMSEYPYQHGRSQHFEKFLSIKCIPAQTEMKIDYIFFVQWENE